MALTPGIQLGPYEITSLIGIGGMGEVYRATDTNLGREVAIKVLPDAFAQDPERLSRFGREAKTLASLNHPNIASIHGLERAAGVRALVLEFVDGPTLADRIAQGPIPLDEALPIARQIADALEAAHEQGIIHRDLKPANIKLRPDGTVKVLDFGLAKAFDPSVSQDSMNALNSPTFTSPAMTLQGVILGTAAYMAPEQARGRAVDKRADVWAFGVVLYEMLTGTRLFAADDVSETLAAVLRAEIDLTALPEGTPASLRRLIQRCLVRDPRQRLRDIGDARLDLNAGDGVEAPNSHATGQPKGRVLERGLFFIIVVTLTAALAMALTSRRAPSAAPSPVIRATLPFGGTPTPSSMAQPPSGAAAAYGIVMPAIAISADGTTIVYAGTANRQSGLFLRRLDQAEPKLIRGTEDGLRPFLSPDGRWVGFWTRDGYLKRVGIDGGVAVTLTEASDVRGASWGQDGFVVYARDSESALRRVKDTGGTPESLTTLDAAKHEKTHRMPDVLPNGKGVLFMIGTTEVDSWDDALIAALPPTGGAPKILLKGGMMPRYVAPGYLVYAHGGDLLAAPFDIDRLEVTGPAVSVASDAAWTGIMGVAEAAISSSVLAYLPGRSTAPNSALIEADRAGVVRSMSRQSRVFVAARWLPDHKRVLVSIDTGNSFLWMLDVERDAFSRLTFHNDAGTGGWNRTTNRALFASMGDIFSVSSDGSGREDVVHRQGGPIDRFDVSSDGRFIMFGAIEGANTQLWLLSTDTRKAERWFPTRFNQGQPRFSPDGQFVAFVSNDTGESQVFVRATAGAESNVQVSTTTGSVAVWSPSGRELFYSDVDNLWAADVRTVDRRIEVGKPRRLFKLPDRSILQDVSPDGQRFLLLQQEPAPAPSAIAVVSGWLETLKPR